MNVECSQQSLAELSDAFRFNDAVIRNLVIRRETADTEPSPLAKSKDAEEERYTPPRAESESSSEESTETTDDGETTDDAETTEEESE